MKDLPLQFDDLAVVPMYYLGDATKILIDGQEYLLVSQDMKKTGLRDRQGFDEEFSHQHIYALHCARRLKVERGGADFSLGMPDLGDFSERSSSELSFSPIALISSWRSRRWDPPTLDWQSSDSPARRLRPVRLASRSSCPSLSER